MSAWRIYLSIYLYIFTCFHVPETQNWQRAMLHNSCWRCGHFILQIAASYGNIVCIFEPVLMSPKEKMPMVSLFFTTSVPVMPVLVLSHLHQILCISTEAQLSLAKNRPVCFTVYSTQHCLEPHRYMSIYLYIIRSVYTSNRLSI